MSFDAFRKNGAGTYYDAVKLPWQADIVTSGLICCFVILAISFYSFLPGIQGKEKLFSVIRITFSLFVGAVILVTNFSMTWETAETHIRTKYKAGTGQEVNVTIGVNIGFRGVNITLKGKPDQIKGETINYNEHFNWEGLQGTFGFGPFASEINQEYRAAQFRGVPLPILWVAEYFTIDGEGIRWGRFYRQAGWYAHIFLWLAFPLWLLSNVQFFILLRQGATFLALTGVSMVLSCAVWSWHRNVNELRIPYTDTEQLQFIFGTSFWMSLMTGVACVILGAVIYLLDLFQPNLVAVFFGVDVLQDSEQDVEVEVDNISIQCTNKRERVASGSTKDTAGGSSMDFDEEEEEEEDEDEIYTYCPATYRPATLYQTPSPLPNELPGRYTRRSRKGTWVRSFQRPRRRPPPSRIDDTMEDDNYSVAGPGFPMTTRRNYSSAVNQHQV